MFQAVIMFCIMTSGSTVCSSVYPEPVMPLEQCEATTARAVEAVRGAPPPEGVRVWAFGYCKPVGTLG